MAGTDVEVASPRGGQLDQFQAHDRRMSALMRECQTLAQSELVRKDLRGKPMNIFALARYGERFGLSPIHSAQRIFIIEGTFQEKAEVLAGVVMRAGHEVRWDEISDERCTVSIRRAGTDYWQSMSWSADQARRAGLLDMWVERWVNKEGGGKRKDVCVVGDDGGVFSDEERRRRALGPVPEWAQKLLEAGAVKRKDPWFQFREDMLCAKAMRRAAARITPDALLGMEEDEFPLVRNYLPPGAEEHLDEEPAEGEIVDGDQPAGEDEPDDDVVEAEVVEDGAPESGPGVAAEADERVGAAPSSSTLDANQGAGDDGADDEALPADQPGGSAPREGGVAASEPAPASGGGSTEGDVGPEAAAPSAPAPTPPADDEPLAPVTFTRAFATQVRESDVDGRRMDDEDRHALVAYATGGRTRSTKEVRKSEISACYQAMKDVVAGRLAIRDVDGVRTVVQP